MPRRWLPIGGVGRKLLKPCVGLPESHPDPFRGLIATMVYTTGRAGAVAKLRLRDFNNDGRQWVFHL